MGKKEKDGIRVNMKSQTEITINNEEVSHFFSVNNEEIYKNNRFVEYNFLMCSI